MAPCSQRRTQSPLQLLSSSPILSFALLPFLLFFLSFPAPTSAAGSAVLGIDVGTEYLKAALVKPGIPLEIVLTKDSKRKESAVVAYKPTRQNDALFPERFYGGDALALSARYPDDVYVNLKTLLGLPFSDGKGEQIESYQARFPALRLEEAPGERGTIGLRSNRLGEAERKDAFLVEELLAMQLRQIKLNADNLAGKGSDVRDVVITYPSFYTADEKRSLQLAAELAGLNIDAFVSDGLAVGLNYAMSRTFPSVSDGGKPEYHIVYDMGAGSTTATVLRFQSRKVKDIGRFNKTVQEIQVLGSGSDRTLGGDSLNDLLIGDMVSQLVEDKRLKNRVTVADVRSHGKTMARLWKDAEKARQVLSANSETGASFESLYDENVHLKYRVSRSRFEELADGHIARVGKPLEQALAAAGLQLNDVDSVVLHGGAIRTPFVQRELEKVCGGSEKIRTNVNADEAAVFGAAFKGAGLSPSFRVKEIRASDASSYPVVLKWPSESKERQQKLFTSTSQIGPEKQVTVKNLEDFEFSFYQQVPIPEGVVEVPVLGVKTQNLTDSVTKLKESFGCSESNVTTKFSIRLSPLDGLPEVSSGSVSCEVEHSMLGSAVEGVKGFFGLGSKQDDQVPLGEDGEPKESVTLEAEGSQASASSSADENATTDSAKESKKAPPQPRLEVIPVGFTASPLGIPAPSPAELARIQSRLAAFDASDRDRLFREEALNELESFIYRSRDLAGDEEFVKVLTQDQLALLAERVSVAGDWIYEAEDAKTSEFQEKLKSLKEIVDPALKRKQENAARPARVQTLQESLKNAQMVINVMEKQIKQDEEIHSSSMAAASTSAASESKFSESASPSEPADADDLEDDAYTGTTSESSSAKTTPAPLKYSIFQPSDLTSLSETYESASSWLEDKLALQEQLSVTDDPSLTVAEIDSHLKRLERISNRIYEKMGAAAKKSSNDKSTKKNSKKEKAEKPTQKDEQPVKEEEKKEEEKPNYNKKDEL